MLCLSRDRPPHGHATTGVGSSGFSAGLVSLPAIHELPLDDSSGDSDSKVDAHPPYTIPIGVCPQSRQTPDPGTPASQLTAVGPTQDRAATGPAAVIPHHSLDAENAFLHKEKKRAMAKDGSTWCIFGQNLMYLKTIATESVFGRI